MLAVDAAGNASAQSTSASATTSAVAVAPPAVDTQAPTVPSGLVASKVTNNSITLSWQPSTDNVAVAGYDIYLNDVLFATSPTTTFTHTGLKHHTTYQYRVSAHDAVPNYSAWTATLSVKTK